MSEYTKYDGPVLIIEIQGHAPYYLRPGNSLTVGRSAKNDIVLDDRTASRKHAVLRWEGKFPLISDRNSTAGTLVDKEYVSFKHLHGLHRIKIGSSYLRVDLVRSEAECPTEVEVLNLKAKNAILEDLTDSDAVTLIGEGGSEDIVGYLTDNKAIQKLLIHLEMSRRTGTLSITEGSLTAVLIYGLGKIKAVQCGNRSGVQALQHVCKFSRGSYHFTVNFDVRECHLNLSAMFYLRDFNKMVTKKRPRPKFDDKPLLNSHDEDQEKSR